MDNKEKIRLTGYSTERGLLKYIKNHIDKYRLLQSTFLGDLNGLKKVVVFFDFLISVALFGAGINDYFQYNFNKRSFDDRSKFIVGRKWKKIINVCNGGTNHPLFDNKTLFNRKFGKFLKRDWLDTENATYSEFEEFIKKHSVFFLKREVGSGGNGISKVEVNQINDKETFFNELKNGNYILEEPLIQHKEIAEFNPSSVNTIRVVTIRKNDEVLVMDAVLRMGNGNNSTDNFHQHGLAMKLDVLSGEVITHAVDKSNGKYLEHPTSKKKLVGFVVPNWNNVIATIKEAAMLSEKIRYVGWDVAILENGDVAIIEGNCSSDPDITQMPDQEGKWPKYKKELEAL